MCGIFAVIGHEKVLVDDDKKKCDDYAKSRSLMLSHRGPEESGYEHFDQVILSHERLSIVDVAHGKQPLHNESKTVWVVANGEIYNHDILRDMLVKNYDKKPTFITHSDSEIVIHMYEKFGPQCIKMFDGVFAFVLYDLTKNLVFIGRGPIGVISMYIGIGKKESDQISHKGPLGGIWIASEMKSLINDCIEIDQFQPGSYICMGINDINKIEKLSDLHSTRYYDVGFKKRIDSLKCLDEFIPELPSICSPYIQGLDLCYEGNHDDIKRKIRDLLIIAVEKRIPREVPYGVLLSGGLDSSLVASIVHYLSKTSDEIANIHAKEKIRTFSVGFKGANSPDLIYAKQVADVLGTEHHNVEFTLQEGLKSLEKVIWHLETFDVTTIRASTPMFMLSQYVRNLGIKVILSGEGSDEIFGGYLYFHRAPNDEEFDSETKRLVESLHMFDCLRANKSTMAWSIEPRVPFLDAKFLNYVLSVPAKYRRCGEEAFLSKFKELSDEERVKAKQEKYILRSSFSKEFNEGYAFLPESVLWRQKEQFSDGVGYSWIDELKAYTEKNISDKDFSSRHERFPIKTPTTKEGYYYRVIFEQLFPSKACINPVESWIPKAEWGCPADPSGRAQSAHEKSN